MAGTPDITYTSRPEQARGKLEPLSFEVAMLGKQPGGFGTPWDGGATTRAIDYRYLHRPAATGHRPYFDFVAERAQEVLGDTSGSRSVLDIGCANGAFLHFLLEKYPKIECAGIDALPELVAYAKRQVPAGRFAVGDIERAETLPHGRFSLVTMLTIHSHVDAIEPCLDNVLSLVEDAGKAILFGLFNPEPVDVLVRVRVSRDGDSGWMPGWNVHSRASWATQLERRSCRFTFHDYVVPDSMPTYTDDPLRTRRAVLDGQLVLRNGASLILPFALLEISR